MGFMEQTCTLIRRTAGTAVDYYGEPTSGTTTLEVACEIQQVRRSEPDEEGELSVSDWMGFFPSGTSLDTGDAVSEASLGTFEVVGRPWDANTGSAAVNHVEVSLRVAD